MKRIPIFFWVCFVMIAVSLAIVVWSHRDPYGPVPKGVSPCCGFGVSGR